MAKNNVVAWTPESKALATERVNEITNIVNKELKTIDKGYMTIAPLINEVYSKELFILAGYSNMDKYCKAEFNMSHGTQCGLRKVYNRYLDESTGDIGEKYKEYGYTKLLTIMESEKDFESVGINPFEEFTPEMTIREMKETLSLKLAEKAKDQDTNAIDTTATEVDNKSENKTASNNATEVDNASATAITESREESFNDYLAKVKQATADLSAFSSNEPKEVVQVIDTILGYIKTLEKTYNKVHATAKKK